MPTRMLGQMVILAILFLIAQRWRMLRPLRHFILIAFLVNAFLAIATTAGAI